MVRVGTLLLKVAQGLALLAIVRGIFFALGERGYHPDLIVARMIDSASTVTSQLTQATVWILSGISALVLLAIANVLTKRATASIGPTGTQSHALSLYTRTPPHQTEASATTDTRDVWLRDAIWYALWGKWEPQPSDPATSADVAQRLFDLCADFRQRAFEGVLPIWGKTDRYDDDGLWRPIPQAYWGDFKINYLLMIEEPPERLATEASRVGVRAAAKHHLMTNRAAVGALWPKIAPSNLPAKIEIVFHSGSPYEVTSVSGMGTQSIARIGVRNSGSKTFSNCKVFIDQVAPLPEWRLHLPLMLSIGAFMLHPDDPEILVDIAIHSGNDNKFRFVAPHGFFAETLGLIDDSVPRTFVLRVEATECVRKASFRVTTDANKTLHFEFISYLN